MHKQHTGRWAHLCPCRPGLRQWDTAVRSSSFRWFSVLPQYTLQSDKIRVHLKCPQNFIHFLAFAKKEHLLIFGETFHAYKSKQHHLRLPDEKTEQGWYGWYGKPVKVKYGKAVCWLNALCRSSLLQCRDTPRWDEKMSCLKSQVSRRTGDQPWLLSPLDNLPLPAQAWGSGTELDAVI